MTELFDKTIMSISCLFVITLTIYILFTDGDDDYDDDDYDDDDMEGFTQNEKDEFKEYATFYGTGNITEGFSFTGDYEEEDTIIEGLNIGRKFKDFGKKIKDVGKKPKEIFNKDLGKNPKEIFNKDFGKNPKEIFNKDFGKNIINKDLGKKMQGELKNVGKKIKGGLEKAGDKITNALLKPFIPMIATFKTVANFFKSIPCRIRHFNGGFRELGDGLKSQFDNLGKGLKLGFSDIFGLIGTLGTCGIHFLKNLGNCIFYYILEMIGHIIYTIFFVFPVYVIKSITGMDMMSYVKQLWKIFYYFDSIIYSATRMHFMHFPDSVIKQCYTCDFMGKVNKINKDWDYTIPKLLNEPINHFKKSGRHFKKIVSNDKPKK